MVLFALPSIPSHILRSFSTPASSSATSATYHLLPVDQSMADAKDDVVTLEDGDASVRRHAVLNDPELEGLTLYEKKAHLVNRELNSHGMGRYQWYIFFLCGFGYFIDLLYAQAFGFIEPAIQQEFGFDKVQSGNIFSSFSAGLTAGAFVWGVLVDIIGRQYAFNLTVLVTSVFGLVLAAPNSYAGVLVITAFVGFGVGGNIPIDTTICLEFIPQNRRFLLATLSVFQPLGVVVSSGLSYAFIPQFSCGNGANGDPLPSCHNADAGVKCCSKSDNMGWRYNLLCLGGICLAIFFLRFVVFNFQESPKYLLYKGHDEKAVKVLHHIARFNNRESVISLEIFEALADDETSISSQETITPILGGGAKQLTATWQAKIKLELQRYKILFSTFNMARLTILVWITYIFDYWAFSIAGSFLPTILLQKNAAIKVSVGRTYRNFIIIYIWGIPGVLLGAFMYGVPRVGRKWAMVGSAALMGVSLFLYATVDTEISNIALNALEYFFQSMFNAVLYGWTPEVFPAPIRGTASGLASFWGRLFSIVSPLIAAKLLVDSLNGPLYLAGAGAFVSALAIMLVPIKSMGAQSY